MEKRIIAFADDILIIVEQSEKDKISKTIDQLKKFDLDVNKLK